MFSQRALNERGIDKMLKEVRDDNRENDAEHMKPVSPKPGVMQFVRTLNMDRTGDCCPSSRHCTQSNDLKTT